MWILCMDVTYWGWRAGSGGGVCGGLEGSQVKVQRTFSSLISNFESPLKKYIIVISHDTEE